MNSHYAKTLFFSLVFGLIALLFVSPSFATCPTPDPSTGEYLVTGACNTGTGALYVDGGTIGAANSAFIKLQGSGVNLVIGTTLVVTGGINLNKSACTNCFVTLPAGKQIIFKKRPFYIDTDGDGYPDSLNPVIAGTAPESAVPKITLTNPDVLDLDTTFPCPFNTFITGSTQPNQCSGTAYNVYGSSPCQSGARGPTPSPVLVYNDITTISTGTGSVLSPAISYSWFPGATHWQSLSWNDDETYGKVSYQIYYDVGGVATIIPNSSLTNNSVGFTTSPVDISGLNTGTYSSLYVKATLYYIGRSPKLNDWTISTD